MSLATRLEDRFGIHPNEAHRLGAILTAYTPELFRKNYPTQSNLMRVSAGLYVGLSGKTFFIVKYGNSITPDKWLTYHAKSLALITASPTLKAVRELVTTRLFRQLMRAVKYPLTRSVYTDTYRAMRMFCIGKHDHRSDYLIKAVVVLIEG